MELIILNDGMYHLVPLTKAMMEGLALIKNPGITCSDLCDIVRLKLTTYSDTINGHILNDNSGTMVGCICK